MKKEAGVPTFQVGDCVRIAYRNDYIEPIKPLVGVNTLVREVKRSPFFYENTLTFTDGFGYKLDIDKEMNGENHGWVYPAKYLEPAIDLALESCDDMIDLLRV